MLLTIRIPYQAPISIFHGPGDSSAMWPGPATSHALLRPDPVIPSEPAGITGDVKADAGVFVNDHIPDGDHVVRLTLPAHCRADSGTERKITLSPQRRSAVVRFEVRCS